VATTITAARGALLANTGPDRSWLQFSVFAYVVFIVI
jgi:hypothetical protein